MTLIKINKEYNQAISAFTALLASTSILIFNGKYKWKTDYYAKQVLIKQYFAHSELSGYFLITRVAEKDVVVQLKLEMNTHVDILELNCLFIADCMGLVTSFSQLVLFPPGINNVGFKLKWTPSHSLDVYIYLHRKIKTDCYNSRLPSVDNNDNSPPTTSQLYLNSELSDLILLVKISKETKSETEIIKIPIHESILSSSSEYFRIMLNLPFYEAQQRKIHIQLKHAQTIYVILQCIYTNEIPTNVFNESLSLEILIEIYEKMDEWRVSYRFLHHSSLLIYQKLSPENYLVIRRLTLSHRQHFPHFAFVSKWVSEFRKARRLNLNSTK